MMKMRSILTAGAFVFSAALMAQTGVSPNSRDRASARDGAASNPRAAGKAEAGSDQAQRIAEAYTRVLYLSKKEESGIQDRLNNLGRDMEGALAQLAKAQMQVDQLLEAEMRRIDSEFGKEQIRELENARLTGAWDCIVDPCKCNLQPVKKEAKRGAVPTERSRSQGAPTRDGNDSRLTPDGSKPTKR